MPSGFVLIRVDGGWIDRGVRRVKVVIGIVAVAGGLEGGDFGFGGGGGTVTANSARGAEGKACEDADDGDDGEKFDQGESRLLTPRTQSPDRVGVKSERIVFCEVNIRGDLSELSVSKYFLVERGESGCSHRYDLNFISQISKGKKQFVHLGGVAGGDFDYWVAGGVGFARD